MKILKTDLNNFDESIVNEAINVMADGGVVLYPTDTVYGLGANIFNRPAVKKIFNIKHRKPIKPLSILISNKNAVDLVANLQIKDSAYVNKYFPGPYTLIFEKSAIIPRTVTGGSKNVGVRVPDCELACRLASIFPIVTTSANITDKETLSTPDEIIKQLGGGIDLVIDVGPLENNNPSTIINLTVDDPIIFKR